MTVEDYLKSQGLSLDERYPISDVDRSRRDSIMDGIEKMRMIGLVREDAMGHLLLEEVLPDESVRELSDPREITFALRELSNSFNSEKLEKGDLSSTNRLLYGIMKTHDKMQGSNDLLPHTVDAISSMTDLYFHYYPDRHVITRDGRAREVVCSILPYEIASGDVYGDDFYTRLQARIDGYAILKSCYYGSQADTRDVKPLKTVQSFVHKLFHSSDSSREGVLMNKVVRTIHENAHEIIHHPSSGFIHSIESYPTDNPDIEQLESTYMIFPEVSMIYACSLIGNEDVRPLFDMNLNQLEDYTCKVLEKYYQNQKEEEEEQVSIQIL